jgi:membrane protein
MLFIDMTVLKFYWNVLVDSFSKFSKDDIFTYAAALSYYTIFSLPPMLLIILYTATLFYNEGEVKDVLFSEIGDLVGQEGTQQIIQTIENLQIFKPTVWATALGIGVLIFTSTTVFITMQNALNKIFRVKPNPQGLGIFKMIKDRVLSFSLLIGLAFILLVSLAINSLIAAFGDYLQDWIGDISLVLTFLTSAVIPFLIITLLFATIFKLLPDATLKWRDVWFGAVVTSILFNIGKYLISFYIGNSNVAGLYDAAGSIMVIMVWVFYASLIFMFGAVFTFVRMKKMGDRVKASEFATQYKVIKTENQPSL